MNRADPANQGRNKNAPIAQASANFLIQDSARPADEMCFVTVSRKTFHQRKGVLLRAAQFQLRDDMTDANVFFAHRRDRIQGLMNGQKNKLIWLTHYPTRKCQSVRMTPSTSTDFLVMEGVGVVRPRVVIRIC